MVLSLTRRAHYTAGARSGQPSALRPLSSTVQLIKEKTMKRTYRTFTLAAVIGVILAGCGIFGIDGRAAAAPNDGEAGLSPATRREIARARMATARYHNISRAIADGYVDIDVVIPNMGFHYLRPAILDETFDIEK